MPFDATQINDARTREVYKGLKEEGKLEVSLVDLLCQKVPTSAIPGIEGNIKSLDFQAMAPTNSLTGFAALNAASEEMTTPLSDRPFAIRKIAKHKSYARGLSPDQLFQKIKTSMVPQLNRQCEFEKSAELMTVLEGNGTATTNAQDVTVRNLSAGATETWDLSGSKPLDDLRSAVKDSLADTAYFGQTKIHELQDHADLQSQTGMKHVTRSALADYLSGFLGIPNIILDSVVYQNGAQTAAADISSLGPDAACVFNSANLLYLDWIDAEFETDAEASTNVESLYMRVHGAVIVVNPDYAIAFKDVA